MPGASTSSAVAGDDIPLDTGILDHSLGRSDSTIEGDGPALNLFAFYRKFVLKRQYALTDEEIEEGNLWGLFVGYTSWLGKNFIPVYWKLVDGEMRASKSNNDGPTRIIMHGSLLKYVGRTITWLRRIFSKHPDFINLKVNDPTDVPDWWTRMSPGIKKECKRREQSLDSDLIFGIGATRPLYFNINEHVIENTMEGGVGEGGEEEP